jgi:hypothetical protein
VVNLGSAIVSLKANAGQGMTVSEKRMIKRHHNAVARNEERRKARARARWKALSNTLHADTADNRPAIDTAAGRGEGDEQHLRVLRGFGGGFLERFQSLTDLNGDALKTSPRTSQRAVHQPQPQMTAVQCIEVTDRCAELVLSDAAASPVAAHDRVAR